MREIEKSYYRKKVSKTLDALKKKRYDPYFFEKGDEAKSFIFSQVGPDDTVGVGGSVTLREGLGIVEEIRKRGNTVYDHWEAMERSPEQMEIRKKQRGADVFLSGINAITTDGILVNLDGGGNRVASLCCGPRKVIAVAGLNKLVESLDLAVQRVRNKAAVLNAIRKNVKTPCVETGICSDCNSNERICAALLILLKRPKDIPQFLVILVNEDLGY